MRFIGSEARRKNLILLGPFSRQEQMVQVFFEEAIGEEDQWRDGLWQLYELAQGIVEEGGVPLRDWWLQVWADERFQTLANGLFPRSYECRRFGMRHRCQFETMCFYKEGWEAPIESGQYIDRRPHHQDEVEQAVARGLMLPDSALAEDLDEEGQASW